MPLNHELESYFPPQGYLPSPILEIFQEVNGALRLDTHDQALLRSVAVFRTLLVREVMVPRIDVFALPLTTTIREAALKLSEEGFSRVPIYRDVIDQMCGILMYRDLQTAIFQAAQRGDPSLLDQSIEPLLKPLLYTPESKKIAHLLQDFRKRQTHLAVVVDEYGGTEGIVTIEDVLEQIVGEIEDEYDDDEGEPILEDKEGSGWLVDGRMSLLDLKDKVGVELPEEGDFDTVAGYIFHCAGTIPDKGFTIYTDRFMMKVVRSNERFVEQIRILPISPQNRRT